MIKMSITSANIPALVLCFVSSLFFECSGDHRNLHSFPTRRSSDLVAREQLDHVLAGQQREAGLVLNRTRRELLGGVLVQGDIQLVAHRSEEHTSELQSQSNLVCRLLLEKKKKKK